jgi:hypothetical protein
MLSKTFDFVTTLTLDECEAQLEQLNKPVSSERPRDVFEVTLYPREGNAYNFSINYRRRGQRTYVLLGQTKGSITPDKQQTRVSGRTELDKSVLVQFGVIAIIFLVAVLFARTPILGTVGLIVIAINAVHIYRNFANANDMISTVLLRGHLKIRQRDA